MRVAADGGVGGGDALSRIDDEQCQVGGLEMTAGHDDGELFGHHVGLALPANACGVDKAVLRAIVLDNFIDSVACGAGDGGDYGARGVGECVQ